MTSAFVNTLQRSSSTAFTSLKFYTTVIFVLGFDALLALYNVVAPKKAPGKITKYGGKWPKYIPAGEGDSRSSCPALNALANHGIFPRNGRGISFVELNHAVRENYNFAPTFCWFVPNYISQILSRDYSTGTFDLEDLSVHNGIEHDASILREDTYIEADQGKPSPRIINEFLKCGTGPNGQITIPDLAKFSARRRVEARATNPQFSMAFVHKMFGSANASTMLTHFNGNPVDLRPYLLEERLPDGWEPAIIDAMGLTMMKFNNTVLPVEMHTCEGDFRAKKE